MKLKNKIFSNVFLDAMTLINECNEFSVKDSMILYHLIEELNKHQLAFLDQRNKLITKYGTVNEKDTELSFSLSNKELLQNDLDVLLDIDFEIDYKKIVFPNVDIKLSPSKISTLLELFEFKV